MTVETLAPDLIRRKDALWQAWNRSEIPPIDGESFSSIEDVRRRTFERTDRITHHMGLLNAFLPEVYADIQYLIELEKNLSRVYQDRLASSTSGVNFGEQKAAIDIQIYEIKEAYSSEDKKALGAIFSIGYAHQLVLNRGRIVSERVAA